MFNFPLENPLSSDQWDVSTSYNTLSHRILDDVTRELCIELHQLGEVVKHLIWVTKLEGAVSLVGILEYSFSTEDFRDIYWTNFDLRQWSLGCVS